MTTLTRVVVGKPKAVGLRTYRFTFSDDSIDLMGDSIAANGWDVKDYMRNPVILFAHDATQPPIGRARNVHVEGKRLVGDIEFADEATYPFAATIHNLVAEGYLSACSVGFLPIEQEYATDRKRGHNITRARLIECSVVPCPANSNALLEGKAMTTNVIKSFARGVLRDTRRIDSAAHIAALAEAGAKARKNIAARLKAEMEHRAPGARFHNVAGQPDLGEFNSAAVNFDTPQAAFQKWALARIAQLRAECGEQPPRTDRGIAAHAHSVAGGFPSAPPPAHPVALSFDDE